MAVAPIFQQQNVPLLVFSDVPEDCILLIFNELVADRLGNMPMLATVCRQWKQILDWPAIGLQVFKQAGIPFSKNENPSWQHAYRLAVGNFFINPHNQQPTLTTIPYSSKLNVEESGSVAWISGRGFIHYDGPKFSVCFFATPQHVQSCKTPHRISSLACANNEIVCGSMSGDLCVYSLETWDLIMTCRPHANEVENIFPYEGDWVSVSSSEVVRLNLGTQTAQVIWKIPALGFENVVFFNHYLFFTQYEGATLESYYTALSIAHPQTLIHIQTPLSLNPSNSTLLGWGEQIAFFNNKSSITVARLHPSHQYESDGKTFSSPPSSVGESSMCFFRGDVAFITTPINSYDRDADEVPERISLIDLRGNQNIAFNYIEQTGIALDIVDNYLCTIEGNKFTYLRKDSHEIVMIDFPIPPHNITSSRGSSKRQREDSCPPPESAI